MPTSARANNAGDPASPKKPGARRPSSRPLSVDSPPGSHQGWPRSPQGAALQQGAATFVEFSPPPAAVETRGASPPRVTAKGSNAEDSYSTEYELRPFSAVYPGGADSEFLAHRTAGNFFVDFLPTKAVGSGVRSRAVEGSGEEGEKAMKLIFNRPKPKSTAIVTVPKSAAQGEAAGLVSQEVIEKVYRSNLERKLCHPSMAPYKMSYALRANLGANAAMLMKRHPLNGLGRLEGTTTLANALLGRHEIAELLSGGVDTSRRKRRTADEISHLTGPVSFEDAAGLTSKEAAGCRFPRQDLLRHGAIEPRRALSPDAPEPAARWAERSEAALAMYPESHAYSPAKSHPSLTSSASAPPSSFNSAAGMTSAEVSRHRTNGQMHAPRLPREGSAAVQRPIREANDDIKYSIYHGSGPILVGSTLDQNGPMASEFARARQPGMLASSTLSSSPKLKTMFDGAAGVPSKQLFLKTKAAAHHHFFSENLGYRPVGVPGRGTDAQPEAFAAPGAAGMATSQLFGPQAEELCIIKDQRAPQRRGSTGQLTVPGAATPAGASGGDGSGGGEASHYGIGAAMGTFDTGIPSSNPAAFEGAAGLSTAEQSKTEIVVDIEAIHTHCHGVFGGDTLGPHGQPALAPVDRRRSSQMLSHSDAALPGQTGNTADGRRGGADWLPDAFQGAAGLTSVMKNRADNVATDGNSAPHRRQLPPPSGDSLLNSASLHHAAPSPRGPSPARSVSAPPSPRPRSPQLPTPPLPPAAIDPSSYAHTDEPPRDGSPAAARGTSPGASGRAASPVGVRPWDGLPAAFDGAAGLSSKDRSYSTERINLVRDTRLHGVRASSPIHMDTDMAGMTSLEANHRRRVIGLRFGEGPASRPTIAAEAADALYGTSEATGTPPHQPRVYDIPELSPASYFTAAGLTSSEATQSRDRKSRFAEDKPTFHVTDQPITSAHEILSGSKWAETFEERPYLLRSGRWIDAPPSSPPPAYRGASPNVPAAGMGGPAVGFQNQPKIQQSRKLVIGKGLGTRDQHSPGPYPGFPSEDGDPAHSPSVDGGRRSGNAKTYPNFDDVGRLRSVSPSTNIFERESMSPRSPPKHAVTDTRLHHDWVRQQQGRGGLLAPSEPEGRTASNVTGAQPTVPPRDGRRQFTQGPPTEALTSPRAAARSTDRLDPRDYPRDERPMHSPRGGAAQRGERPTSPRTPARPSERLDPRDYTRGQDSPRGRDYHLGGLASPRAGGLMSPRGGNVTPRDGAFGDTAGDATPRTPRTEGELTPRGEHLASPRGERLASPRAPPVAPLFEKGRFDATVGH